MVSDIQKIDPDWWLVTNDAGKVSSVLCMPASSTLANNVHQTGLVPSNYLQEMDDEPAPAPTSAGAAAAAPAPEPESPAGGNAGGAKATALYDYEAGEDNELSFPENAVITNLVSRSPCH